MAEQASTFEIYLESGKKKTFAAALDWPGWCRHGKDEEGALQALRDAAPRYARALERAGVPFTLPEGASPFTVVERVDGTSTTDFGAPAVILPRDSEPVAPGELERMEQVLRACWIALDEAVEAAEGHALRKGPRGGGRELEAIVEHVVNVDEAYLGSIGRKPERPDGEETLAERHERLRAEALKALRDAVAGNLPARGPRGGRRWPPRYFARRLAWHVLDHVWEIEDRVL